MFQFLRRISGSLLPRPDRPWREDATSNAPTIGRKRRYSLTDRDVNDSPSSATKRTRNDLVKPDADCVTTPEGDSPKGDVISPQDVKEVTKGVKEVDLEDKDKAENPSSILPEGIPLPDSPSASPELEPESPEQARSEVLEETQSEVHPDREDSVASSLPQDGAEEGAEDDGRTEAASVKTIPADGATQALVVTAATVESDVPETLETEESCFAVFA